MVSAVLATSLLATAISVHAQAASGSDCSYLVNGVLQPWAYVSADPTALTTCCTGALAQNGAVVCDATGTYITELHLTGNVLQGQVPSGIMLLSHLSVLDISNNPAVATGLSTLAGIPSLTSLNVAGCGFNGPVPQFANSITCTMDSKSCGNPGCQQATPIPMCSTPAQPGDNNPADFVPFTTSTVLWILVGVFGGILLILSAVCYGCNQRGAVAQRLLDNPTLPTHSEKKQADPAASEALHNSGEMAMITLSRNGIPKRTFSMVETRKLQTKDEAAMDVSAREPFVVANGGSESFPVRRYYAKELADELSLTDGDSVVLTKVFRDGWAEGVSMRAGGPALFPLACLGGGVPIVLAERLRVARMMARGGPSDV
ncbi:hypothetical protein HDU98_008101 [Podochytrium sp. JEL0797]|nr:hypothetical protein HDU98_008101 [Podochytrium sp. JEL0797]